MNRRNFFKKTAVAGAAMISIPEIVRAAMPETAGLAEATATAKYALPQGARVLFQGDSITDWRRDKKKEADVNAAAQLGQGYTLFTAAQLLAGHPAKQLQIYNRGISGNKVYQLAERWDKDCLEIKPDLLSILIGVNDYWHTKLGRNTRTVADYENDYRALLKRTRQALPNTRIVLCEPFLIHGGTALDETWEGEFAPYREVVKKLAKEFKLTLVPFQTVYNKALEKAPASYWGADGVHPSLAGAQLMAEAWVKAVL
jgi:lysophospholipase L1-like esterase